MKRSGPPARKKPMKRVPMKQGRSKKQRRDAAEMDAATPELLRRSGGWCECGRGCGLRGAVRHHVDSRRHGDNSPENLRWLSDACHKWVHAEPKKARKLGLLPPNAKDDLEPG